MKKQNDDSFFPGVFSGETLLQQKLQESNSQLYSDVGQMLKQVYGSASKEVHSVLLSFYLIIYVLFVLNQDTVVLKMQSVDRKVGR